MLNEKDLTAENLSSQRLYDYRNPGDIEEIKKILLSGVNLKSVFRQAYGTDLHKLCIRKEDGKVCEFKSGRRETAAQFHWGRVVIAENQGRSNTWDDSIKEWV
jgi:hypothetical protein